LRREFENPGSGDQYPTAIENNLVHQIKNYIHGHLSEKLSIDEMAKALKTSRSMIFLTMKRELDTTPLAYHAGRRIELAKEMLRTPDIPLTTIALDLGFSSSQHFSTVFKKLEGMAPSHYRDRE